ncbi:MAG: hypothetical protein AM326_12565 [Candidatus Thorarchaeota archaeon SMTZ-45]|nr:MAG: hypothetical protein AM325_11925 [Candidatus Thorarchaeota archaeon SMTZ1-45]KXH77198.1 MAG: hypothetical protein AM326_12565 [Candidatus Thorarchaeota archaeon SMTZ-45]
MSKAASERSLVFFIIAAIMIILVLVLPFAYRIDIGPGPDSIRAMTWDYIESTWYSGFRFWNPLDTLPYTILRLVFAVYLARFCLGSTTAKTTVLIGILAELQPIIVSAPLVYFIDWSGDPLVPLYIPVPIMLLLGIILVLILKGRYAKD